MLTKNIIVVFIVEIFSSVIVQHLKKRIIYFHKLKTTQSAGAVEYADCISAKG